MGHSHGGYSTLALIVETTRFKAAVSSAGYGNLIGNYGKMRADGSSVGIDWSEQGPGLMGGTPGSFVIGISKTPGVFPGSSKKRRS